MLKKLDINGKTIPVPVPILNLSEAVSWLENSILKKGQLITKILLNGKECSLEDTKNSLKTNLLKDSVLSVQADSPRDLAIQTIDTLRDLVDHMFNKLQELAVYCWKQEKQTKVEELDLFLADCKLALELVAHINGMVDFSHADMAPVNGLSILISNTYQQLITFNQNKEWKVCADILLNRIEPLFKDLVGECEFLELRVFSAENIDGQLPTPSFRL